MIHRKAQRWQTILHGCVNLSFLLIVMTTGCNLFTRPGAGEQTERPKQELLDAVAEDDEQYQTQAYKDSQEQVPAEERIAALPADVRDNVNAYIDVLYGKTVPEFQTLDAFILKSATPTPVLIEVHSGGFSKKTKSRKFFYESDGLYMKALRAGISVVTIDYRLSPQYVFPAHAEDVGRAIQFIRSKGKEWNIDPARIASSGGSAGAHLSTWVGFHDDMANPASEDPIERYSTRLAAIVEWRGPMDFTRFSRNMSSFLGIPPEEYGKTEASLEKMRFASPVNYASPDDPPILLVYTKVVDFDLNEEVPATIDDPHIFWWGIFLNQALNAKEVPHEVLIEDISDAEKADVEVDFLKKHLLKEGGSRNN